MELVALFAAQVFSNKRSKQILCVLFFCLSGLAHASTANSKSGFLDFNLYPYLSDVDSDTSATLNIASSFARRISYFSLTNLGNQNNAEALDDVNTFYSEHNVRWQIHEESPLDLTLQMNFRSGEDNDRHRLGIRWRLNDTLFLKDFFSFIHLKYTINVHILQFDNEDTDVWQMEHAYRLTSPWLSDRLYLAGFIDHTFNERLPPSFPENPIVSETQLGFRLVENMYIVAEYRINQYRRSDINNIAAGLEYIVKW